VGAELHPRPTVPNRVAISSAPHFLSHLRARSQTGTAKYNQLKNGMPETSASCSLEVSRIWKDVSRKIPQFGSATRNFVTSRFLASQVATSSEVLALHQRLDTVARLVEDLTRSTAQLQAIPQQVDALQQQLCLRTLEPSELDLQRTEVQGLRGLALESVEMTQDLLQEVRGLARSVESVNRVAEWGAEVAAEVQNLGPVLEESLARREAENMRGIAEALSDNRGLLEDVQMLGVRSVRASEDLERQVQALVALQKSASQGSGGQSGSRTETERVLAEGLAKLAAQMEKASGAEGLGVLAGQQEEEEAVDEALLEAQRAYRSVYASPSITKVEASEVKEGLALEAPMTDSQPSSGLPVLEVEDPSLTEKTPFSDNEYFSDSQTDNKGLRQEPQATPSSASLLKTSVSERSDPPGGGRFEVPREVEALTQALLSSVEDKLRDGMAPDEAFTGAIDEAPPGALRDVSWAFSFEDGGEPGTGGEQAKGARDGSEEFAEGYGRGVSSGESGGIWNRSTAASRERLASVQDGGLETNQVTGSNGSNSPEERSVGGSTGVVQEEQGSSSRRMGVPKIQDGAPDSSVESDPPLEVGMVESEAEGMGARNEGDYWQGARGEVSEPQKVNGGRFKETGRQTGLREEDRNLEKMGEERGRRTASWEENGGVAGDRSEGYSLENGVEGGSFERPAPALRGEPLRTNLGYDVSSKDGGEGPGFGVTSDGDGYERYQEVDFEAGAGRTRIGGEGENEAARFSSREAPLYYQGLQQGRSGGFGTGQVPDLRGSRQLELERAPRQGVLGLRSERESELLTSAGAVTQESSNPGVKSPTVNTPDESAGLAVRADLDSDWVDDPSGLDDGWGERRSRRENSQRGAEGVNGRSAKEWDYERQEEGGFEAGARGGYENERRGGRDRQRDSRERREGVNRPREDYGQEFWEEGGADSPRRERPKDWDGPSQRSEQTGEGWRGYSDEAEYPTDFPEASGEWGEPLEDPAVYGEEHVPPPYEEERMEPPVLDRVQQEFEESLNRGLRLLEEGRKGLTGKSEVLIADRMFSDAAAAFEEALAADSDSRMALLQLGSALLDNGEMKLRLAERVRGSENKYALVKCKENRYCAQHE
jgi:hypothetical protein